MAGFKIMNEIEALKELKRFLGIKTNREFAHRIGLTESHLSKILKGERRLAGSAWTVAKKAPVFYFLCQDQR